MVDFVKVGYRSRCVIFSVVISLQITKGALDFQNYPAMSGQEHSPKGRDIPAIKRVVLNDVSQLPPEYSTTPGGTLFSTTPGGTRIVYDRSRLMQLRNSPLARSPPANMAKIPGITDFDADAEAAKAKKKQNEHRAEPKPKENKEDAKVGHDEHPQFEMDI